MMTEEQNTISPTGDDSSDGDTRQKILATALMEFTEYGVEGARVDRIARSAGVNKALIYYYFSSKQQLYEEALKAAFANVITSVHAVMTGGTDLEAVLQATAAQYLQVFLTRAEVPQLILRELANPESALVAQLANTIAESGVPAKLVQFLRDGQADGSVRPVDVRQAVVSFMTMQIGYFLMRPLINGVLGLEDDRQFMIERKEAVVDLFLHGVKAR